ncbi:hypothetical protein [Candidatus Cyrtobacter comes]|nr:hypothetical protein [Candidatus Cyrtobacter comes]
MLLFTMEKYADPFILKPYLADLLNKCNYPLNIGDVMGMLDRSITRASHNDLINDARGIDLPHGKYVSAVMGVRVITEEFFNYFENPVNYPIQSKDEMLKALECVTQFRLIGELDTANCTEDTNNHDCATEVDCQQHDVSCELVI